MKKKLASIGLALTMIFNSTAALAYYDINSHWAKGYINEMKNMNVLNQFIGNYIEPDKPMTREECAVLISDFLEVYAGYKPPYKNNNYKFPDLRNNQNADKIRALSLMTYKSYMTGNGKDDLKIINGIKGSDGRFYYNPNEPITRAEFTKMLLSALDCFGYIMASDALISIATDCDLHWAIRYIRNANGFGILNGYIYHDNQGPYTVRYDLGNGVIETLPGSCYIEFRPENQVTRAEAIKMISKAKELDYVGLGLGTSRPINSRDKLNYLSY
ncbi:MAG: S-layer homology domain-containing protein [Andreesenia angusta]|nr:S-layer homology domain-containing protein [Andreesenia angusta]